MPVVKRKVFDSVSQEKRSSFCWGVTKKCWGCSLVTWSWLLFFLMDTHGVYFYILTRKEYHNWVTFSDCLGIPSVTVLTSRALQTSHCGYRGITQWRHVTGVSPEKGPFKSYTWVLKASYVYLYVTCPWSVSVWNAHKVQFQSCQSN